VCVAEADVKGCVTCEAMWVSWPYFFKL